MLRVLASFSKFFFLVRLIFRFVEDLLKSIPFHRLPVRSNETVCVFVLQSQFEAALAQLQREDPSLRVRFDEESAQTILEGMGAL